MSSTISVGSYIEYLPWLKRSTNGWCRTHDVAAAGGWTDTQALTLIYQKATPAGVLVAVTRG